MNALARPIHVAMLTQAYLPHVGGAERQLAALLPLLRARGVRASIITRRYPGMKASETLDGTPVYRIPLLPSKPGAALSYLIGALWQLSRLRPDLIHAFELLSPAATALSAKKLWKIPLAAKVLRGGPLGDVDKLQRRALGKNRLRALREEMDAFITISAEIDSEIASLGVPPERRFFIPNGVDTEHFAPLNAAAKTELRRRLGLPLDAPLILYSGRLVAEKRVNHLLTVWPALRQQFPAACLLILGDGPEKSRLSAAPLPGLSLLGLVEDVAPYLQAADIFVLPSATEGLSNAMLEALAAGLAVTVTAVGGAPDVIQHGQNGLLIAPDDLPALQNALEVLLANPALRQALGRAGRETILSRYSLHQTADQLTALYQSLLAGRQP
ncbi:MAG: glycosyltransferase family 4 protein [Anaerolineales bacterium]